MSDSGSLPVAMTKLKGPSVPGHFVARPRLQAVLERTRPGGVGLVVAPAGWGKSVAVADWLTTSGRRAAWCRFDHSDRSSTRFCSVVCAALADALPGSVDESVTLAKVPTVDVDRHLIPTLINEVLATGEELWLVLDDTDRAATSENIATLSQLATARLPNLGLVVVSRSQIELERGRLAIEGLLVEVERSELAFTIDEVRSLIHCDVAAAAELVERTGGWPAGLVFETRLGSHVSGPDLLSDYLEHELLGSGRSDLWEFLTDMSLLDAITERAALTVRPDTEPAELLRAADQLGLTERDDGPPFEWRFVPLFGDFFRARLRRQGDAEVLQRELRTAEALVAGGDYHGALTLVERAAATDPSASQTLFDGIWLDALNHGAFDEIERVAEQLSARDADVHPPAAMAAAWAALNRGRFQAAQLWNERVRAAMGRRNAVEFPELIGGPEMLDAHVLRHLGQLDAAIDAAEAALSLMTGADDTPGYAAACTALGQNLFWSDPARAADILEEGRRVGEITGENVSVITCAGHLAVATAINDRPTPRRDVATNAINLAGAVGLAEHHHTAAAHLALGLQRVAAGDADGAELDLERAVLLAERGREPYERSLAELALADLAHRSGNTAEANQRLADYEKNSRDLYGSVVLDSFYDRLALEASGSRAEQQTNQDLVEPLTPRELTVLRLLRSPLTQREIANELFVSFNTSRTHTKAIYRKLGVASRSEAVAAARRAGLL